MSVNKWEPINTWIEDIPPPITDIGNITVSFGKDIYSVDFEEDTITVKFN